MTLKQSQGHQTYNENVDPEQVYNHAKFERSRFNSVREKSERGNMSVMCLKHLRKYKIVIFS